MTIEQYIKRKNEILKKYTGITLVPKEYITSKGISRKKLTFLTDATLCPYCIDFYGYGYEDCPECPMNDINCSDDDSTWNQVTETSRIATKGAPWGVELRELVNKYNEELETT